jgi:hypothetical protein
VGNPHKPTLRQISAPEELGAACTASIDNSHLVEMGNDLIITHAVERLSA